MIPNRCNKRLRFGPTPFKTESAGPRGAFAESMYSREPKERLLLGDASTLCPQWPVLQAAKEGKRLRQTFRCSASESCA